MIRAIRPVTDGGTKIEVLCSEDGSMRGYYLKLDLKGNDIDQITIF